MSRIPGHSVAYIINFPIIFIVFQTKGGVDIIDKHIIVNHRVLLDTMNILVARNKIGELIVVSSKRSTKPTTPFIISSAVFQQWKARDSKAVIMDLPYEELITVIPLNLTVNQNEPLVVVSDFSEIEFTEV
jgi:hypothetical protein